MRVPLRIELKAHHNHGFVKSIIIIKRNGELSVRHLGGAFP